jgi:hypothetical protein
MDIRPMRIPRLFSAAALMLAAACSLTGSGDREYERVPGVLATSIEGEVLVEAPESATAGQTFTLRVVTQGSGCRRTAEPEVSVSGLQAEVKIWDEYPVDGACSRDLLPLEHTVSLRFEQRGTATVRVHGQHDTVIGHQPVTVQRTIVIR